MLCINLFVGEMVQRATYRNRFICTGCGISRFAVFRLLCEMIARIRLRGWLEFAESDRCLLPLPLFQIEGNVITTTTPLRCSSNVLCGRPADL